MTSFPSRPLIDVIREAFRTLEADPGPRTPEKSALMRQLRERIADYEANQRPTDR